MLNILANYSKEINIIIKILGAVFTLIIGLWAYTKYVLERGFLPPVQFYANVEKLGNLKNKMLLSIKIHLHNIGSCTLVAHNIRIDLKYINKDDDHLKLFEQEKNPKNHKYIQKTGRLYFPHSVIKDENIDPSEQIPTKIRINSKKYSIWKKSEKKHRGFLVLEEDTFIQAKVDQIYAFTTMIPEDVKCILVWCSFQYAQRLSWWENIVSIISRRIGLIHYTLKHANQPHSFEEAFWVADKS